MRSDSIRTFKRSDTTDTGLEDYTQLIVDLLSFGQSLCKQTQSVVEQLCQEIRRVTQGRARLLLPCQDSPEGSLVPFPVSISFPLQFHKRTYGRLDICPDSAHPGSPALPLPVAQLLAHICSSLLYTLELSAFIEGQCQRLDCQDPERLTKREQKVLELICRGYDQESIATMLYISPATVETHRKRICGKLGVHCERDIPLAAYQASLFSILNEPITESSASPAGVA
jgi:DNA-binding CsgD family transcriptional regulator